MVHIYCVTSSFLCIVVKFSFISLIICFGIPQKIIDASPESVWLEITRHLKLHNACNGTAVDRTSRVPLSFFHLFVDKGQDRQSRILFFTSLVLPPNES